MAVTNGGGGSSPANSGFDWGRFLLDIADQFIVTPREQMEHEAQLARARADESLAAAQIAAAGKHGNMMNTVLVGAALVGVGLLVVNTMK